MSNCVELRDEKIFTNVRIYSNIIIVFFKFFIQKFYYKIPRKKICVKVGVKYECIIIAREV